MKKDFFIIRRVAVLGAGAMGSRIAAHFANAGVPSLLLDVVLPDAEDRSAVARAAIANAASRKPGAFFTEVDQALITPGNFEDHFDNIRECDWILEAVTEDLEIKRRLLERAAIHRKPGSIISTNTSGIPLARIAEGFPPDFQRSFLGVHFFNPPRYLHLVELIPGPETDPAILGSVAEFCDLRLGKGVVPCKDTPGFISNRIGGFLISTVLKLVREENYTIEEADALTGRLIGLPQTATFRLLDLIGLDVWLAITRNLSEATPPGYWRERYTPPDFLVKTVERGWLGQKTGAGFYKRGAGKTSEVLNLKTLEYEPPGKPNLPLLREVEGITSLGERLRKLIASDDRAGVFIWKLLRDYLLYTAGTIPEISNRTLDIDRVMKWGFGHQLGPFEIWDALGFRETARRMEREGFELPESIRDMLASGAGAFYRPADSDGHPRTLFFDLITATYQKLEERPGVLLLPEIKRARGLVKDTEGGSLVDLGDGALCLEFRGGNVTGNAQLDLIQAALEEAARNWIALILTSESSDFSPALDLHWLQAIIEAKAWVGLDQAVERIHQTHLAVKRSARPVVAALSGTTLDLGCELALHSAAIQASAETYMGLTQARLGLVPFGGGCKEVLARVKDSRRALKLIGGAKISSSAAHARQLGLLRSSDRISMNPERLIGDAKALALWIAPGYSPPPPDLIPIGGGEEYKPEEDKDIATEPHLSHTPHLLAGLLGVGAPGHLVPEEQLLMDERSAFHKLCTYPEVQEHIQKTLEKCRE